MSRKSQPRAARGHSAFHRHGRQSASSTLLEQAGRNIIHMEVGEPSAPPPRPVREAAIAALAASQVGYTDALGSSRLRQRIARHYAETYAVKIASAARGDHHWLLRRLRHGFLALFDAGRACGVSAPGYPAYRNILPGVRRRDGRGSRPRRRDPRGGGSGRRCAQTRRRAGDEPGQPDRRACKATSPCATSPISATARGIKFISDEIYHGLTYERPAQTALAFSQNAVIVVNSFSKYYCMTGWRVGWLVLPPELVARVERLQQSLAISPPTLSQIAAQAALDAREELEAVKAGYRRNRDILLDGLPELGLSTSRRPTAPFMSMPTSAAFPAIPSLSAMTCCIARAGRHARRRFRSGAGPSRRPLLLCGG